MSKTFREGYYDEDKWTIKKIRKTSKQKRHKVKDFLRLIEEDEINYDEDIFEDFED